MLSNGGEYLVRRFQGDLAAVGAIDLVAVVLGGVVAGGDADARAAAEVTHRPGKGRGGLQPGIEVNRNSVGGQYPGGFLAEQLTLDAAVVADGDLFGQVAAVQVIRQTLGRPADGVDIHPVGARADDTPQTAGAEFQIPVEAVCDCIRVAANLPQFLNQIRVLRGAVQPLTELFCVSHVVFLPFFVLYSL